eukprot:COSAG03_NODE_29703_length_179_cov_10.737500_1_plen_22_part_01
MRAREGETCFERRVHRRINLLQ